LCKLRSWENSNDQRGFAFVLSLAMVPLLFSLFVVVAASIWVLNKQQQVEALCIRSVLSGQSKMLEHMNGLFQLNPLASQLRLERRAAELAVKAAHLKPALLPKAKAYLHSVQTRQKALRIQQQSLLMGAKRASFQERQWIRTEMQKAGAQVFSWPQFALHLSKHPPGSDSPSYKPKNGFRKKQQVVLGGQLPLSQQIPSEVSSRFLKQLSPLPFQCSSTLKAREPHLGGQRWRVVLTEAKSLWRP
jgi:hypothetical protein